MGLNIGGEVEKINGKEISYKQFVERYLEKNRPVVLTGLMDGWRASKDWVTPDGNPNLSFFSEHFGQSRVQVAECGSREFTDQKRVEMSILEFINHWCAHSAGKLYNNPSHEGEQQLLYLKDWHFVKENPEYVAYETPLFFVDDWLNLYLDYHPMHVDSDVCCEKNEINCSDYRFVYMGAKGTWTPLHADVFRSYSWSANVCGKKRWHFLSPSQCHLLFDMNMKNSVYDIFDSISETKFPGFKKTIWLECTQEQNEIIFVPSGWYHQVLNMEDTISINHNWFNGYNLSWVWKLLLNDYKEAKEYIDDIRDICDDFEGLCQRNLAANTGMNFVDFFVFISWFSFANLTLFHHYARHDENSIRILSNKGYHLIHNLASMRKVAFNMKFAEDFTGGGLNGCLESFSDIRKIFEKPAFVELCLALNKTYGLIDDQWKPGSITKSTLIGAIAKLDFLCLASAEVTSSKVQDLIKIIDYMITDVSCGNGLVNCSLLSVMDEFDSTLL